MVCSCRHAEDVEAMSVSMVAVFTIVIVYILAFSCAMYTSTYVWNKVLTLSLKDHRVWH